MNKTIFKKTACILALICNLFINGIVVYAVDNKNIEEPILPYNISPWRPIGS